MVCVAAPLWGIRKSEARLCLPVRKKCPSTLLTDTGILGEDNPNSWAIRGRWQSCDGEAAEDGGGKKSDCKLLRAADSIVGQAFDVELPVVDGGEEGAAVLVGEGGAAGGRGGKKPHPPRTADPPTTNAFRPAPGETFGVRLKASGTEAEVLKGCGCARGRWSACATIAIHKTGAARTQTRSCACCVRAGSGVPLTVV